MFIPFENDTNSTLVVGIDNFYSKEECEKIINYINSKPELKEEARINNPDQPLNEKIRKNKIRWILEHDFHNLEGLPLKLGQAVMDANKQHFNFDLYGFTEGIQFTEYSNIKDHYDFHTDSTLNGRVRKLSVIVQLSDEKDYKGSTTEIKVAKDPIIISKKQGSISIFPSYLLHRVTPLLKGTRYSLVSWFGGPKFK